MGSAGKDLERLFWQYWNDSGTLEIIEASTFLIIRRFCIPGNYPVIVSNVELILGFVWRSPLHLIFHRRPTPAVPVPITGVTVSALAQFQPGVSVDTTLVIATHRTLKALGKNVLQTNNGSILYWARCSSLISIGLISIWQKMTLKLAMYRILHSLMPEFSNLLSWI